MTNNKSTSYADLKYQELIQLDIVNKKCNRHSFLIASSIYILIGISLLAANLYYASAEELKDQGEAEDVTFVLSEFNLKTEDVVTLAPQEESISEPEVEPPPPEVEEVPNKTVEEVVIEPPKKDPPKIEPKVKIKKPEKKKENIEQQVEQIAKSSDGSKNIIDNYIAKLQQAIHRNVRYNNRAREQRLQGIATVTFEIDSNGNLINPIISKSSGHQLLDKMTIDAIKRTQSIGNPPEELNVRIFTVPIRLNLKNS